MDAPDISDTASNNLTGCRCPCGCPAPGRRDDDGTPGLCDGCRMNIHPGAAMDAPASASITEAEYGRLIIAQAHQLAPVLRASDSARDRLVGHLLTELAERAEELY